jgi:hypothetical protein
VSAPFRRYEPLWRPSDARFEPPTSTPCGDKCIEYRLEFNFDDCICERLADGEAFEDIMLAERNERKAAGW